MSKEYTVNGIELIRIMEATIGSCKYKLGAKPSLSLAAELIKESDCSGYVRYVLYHTTQPIIRLPEGSWYQEQWCRWNLQGCPYEDAAKDDSIVRIAFIPPQGKKPGHVWLICNSRTIECYGKVGAGRRKWNNTALISRKPRCFVVGKKV